MNDAGLTRRTFLKSVAAAGAAAAFAGGSNLVAADKAYAEGDSGKTEILSTCCRACLASCSVRAHVRDGRLIKMEGDPDGPLTHGAICSKCLSAVQTLYNPNRIKYPLVRVGERGQNNFKRVSWDEALDIVADKLMEVREKYGAETVLMGTGGGGNPHISGPARFGTAFGTPNYFEPGSSMCYLPRQVSTKLTRGPSYVFADLAFYRAQSDAYFAEDGQTDVLVLWGGDPMNSTVAQGGQAIARLLDRGCKLVVIDPRFIPEATKAEIWLPVLPSTDVALMMCWIKYIIDHDLWDHEFVQKWSNLPFLVDPETKYCLRADQVIDGASHDDYVVWDNNTNEAKALGWPYDDAIDAAFFGSYDIGGTSYKTGFQLLKESCDEWTIEKAAQECGLVGQEDDIERAILLYADNKDKPNRPALNHGVGTDQSINASSAAFCAQILECLNGAYEAPGGASQRFGELVPLAGILSDDTFGMRRFDTLTTKDMLLKRLGAIEYKGLNNWHESHVPSVLKAMEEGDPYPIKVWLERSGNKFVMLPEGDRWYRACKNVEMIVHAHMSFTAFTVGVADVVFPMREWTETNRPVLLANKLYARRAVAHVFETVDETILWGKLARKCAERGHENCAHAFDADYVAPVTPLTEDYDELMRLYMDKCEYTWEELLEKAPIEIAPWEKWHQYYVYKYPETGAPEGAPPRGFNTPSKRLEAYLEAAVLLGRTGRPFSLVRGENGGEVQIDLPPASHDYHAVPYYVPPEETAETTPDYPLVSTAGRLPWFHHGTQKNVPWLRELMPTAEIWVNPQDAEKYGIHDKKWVKVTSKRTETNPKAFCHARARITGAIRPGVVYQERYWNPELLDTDVELSFSEQSVNQVSKVGGAWDEMHGTYALRGFTVKIEEDPDFVPKGWTRPEQFEVWLPEPSDTTPVI